MHDTGAQHAPFRACQSGQGGYRVVVISKSTPRWPDQPALFLDLDGTLLDFAPEPARVEVSTRLRAILDDLSTATGGAVAFVSGRTLADLDRLLGEGRFPLAAVHGLERRSAGGELSTMEPDREGIERMHEKLERVARRYPRIHLEHKGTALALHYRGCPELEQQLIEHVEEQIEGMASELILMHGKLVLEIKPGVENKGTAIAAFMSEDPFRGRTPVFVGDDVTDEDGFRVVNELDGVSVKVGSGETGAKFRLADTQSVLDWLDVLLAQTTT